MSTRFQGGDRYHFAPAIRAVLFYSCVMALDVTLKPVETLVFKSDVVALGTFRCPATHPLFRDSGPSTHHTFVFPRSATMIRHAGRARFTAGPNCVTLYNQGQEYSRTRISDIDASDWFVIADDVLAATPGIDAARPFRRTHIPIDNCTYADQRSLFESLGRLDRLAIEEAALSIWRRVASPLAGAPPNVDCARESDHVEEVKRMIVAAPERRLALRDLARAVDSSPFHLCRAFRRVTGMTITAYRHAVRLRMSLSMLRDSSDDLTEIALRLGYASHSHFTAAFRRAFGITPSQHRARS